MRQRDLDRYNRESDEWWRKRHEYVPAKVGTMPMNVWISKADAATVMSDAAVGARITMYPSEYSQQMTGIVDEVRKGADGQLTLLMATRF